MRTLVDIPEEHLEELKRIGKAEKLTRAEMVRRAVTAYIGEWDEGGRQEKRKAFVRDAEAAWAEYQETGFHITLDEALGWMDTWGTEAETKAPACHK